MVDLEIDYFIPFYGSEALIDVERKCVHFDLLQRRFLTFVNWSFDQCGYYFCQFFINSVHYMSSSNPFCLVVLLFHSCVSSHT